MTLIEVRENSGAAPPVEAVRLAEDDPDLLKVRQLRIGSWVEFREDEENTLRCKLTAIIAPANSYIFVNRTGLKVLEKPARSWPWSSSVAGSAPWMMHCCSTARWRR